MTGPATMLPVTVWPPSAQPKAAEPYLAIAAPVLKRARYLLPRIIRECVGRHGPSALALCGQAAADYGHDGVFAVASLLADTIIVQSGLDTAVLRHSGELGEVPPQREGTVDLPVGAPMFGTAGHRARLAQAASFLTACVTGRADLAYNQGVRDTDREGHASLLEGLLDVLASVLDGVLKGPDPRTAIAADVLARGQALRGGLITACRSKDPHRAANLFTPVVAAHGVDGAWAVAIVLAETVCTISGVNEASVATAHDMLRLLPSVATMFGTDGRAEHLRHGVALGFIHGHLTDRHDATYAALRNGSVVAGDLLQGLCEVTAAALADDAATQMPWDDAQFWDGARLARVARFAHHDALAACAQDLISRFMDTPGCSLRIDQARPGVYLLCFTHPITVDPDWADAIKTIIVVHGGICDDTPRTIDLADPEETP